MTLRSGKALLRMRWLLALAAVAGLTEAVYAQYERSGHVNTFSGDNQTASLVPGSVATFGRLVATFSADQGSSQNHNVFFMCETPCMLYAGSQRAASLSVKTDQYGYAVVDRVESARLGPLVAKVSGAISRRTPRSFASQFARVQGLQRFLATISGETEWCCRTSCTHVG
jgi:hypothetical protein